MYKRCFTNQFHYLVKGQQGHYIRVSNKNYLANNTIQSHNYNATSSLLSTGVPSSAETDELLPTVPPVFVDCPASPVRGPSPSPFASPGCSCSPSPLVPSGCFPAPSMSSFSTLTKSVESAMGWEGRSLVVVDAASANLEDEDFAPSVNPDFRRLSALVSCPAAMTMESYCR